MLALAGKDFVTHPQDSIVYCLPVRAAVEMHVPTWPGCLPTTKIVDAASQDLVMPLLDASATLPTTDVLVCPFQTAQREMVPERMEQHARAV